MEGAEGGERELTEMRRRRFIHSLSATLPVFSFDQLVDGMPLGVQFVDVARKAGVTTNQANGQQRWNTGCAVVDYDRDGNLNLFVANYVDFDPKTAPLPESGPCLFRGIVVACGPPGLQGGKNILYHNNGDGRFRCQREGRNFEDARHLRAGRGAGGFRQRRSSLR